MLIARLALTDFRNHAAALIEPGPGFVLLSGDNGAGKTNVLEAVSLLTPGRGLRGAALGEMARSAGPGGFGVAARLAWRQSSVATGHARHRARAAAGAHQRRRGLGQFPVRMACRCCG